MSVPYALVLAITAVLVAGIVIVWVAAPALARSGAVPDRRVREVRIGAGGLLGVLVVLVAILSVAGMPLLPNAEPLHIGNAYGGDDPRLLAFRSDFTPPGTFGQALYAYAPGAELRTGLQLANDGPAALTVTGLEPSGGPTVRSLALRLAPGPPPAQITLPLYRNQGSARWLSEPFHPFTIPAHDQVGVGLAVTLGTCASAQPQPTRAPGASLLPDSDPALNGGFGAVDTLRIEYTVLGIQRTAVLPLPLAIVVVTGQSTFGCPPA